MAKKVKDTPEASRMIVSPGYRAFTIFNDILIGIICIAMLYPFLYLIAQSFSSTEAIVAGKVGIVPVGFSVDTYKYVLKDLKSVDSSDAYSSPLNRRYFI